MRFSVLPLLLCTLTLPARACLNDRDTDSLAKAGARLPDTVRIITGRFERNPPLYYTMRIGRCRAELQKDPLQFNLYDDIAVAEERLGNSREALACMELKRKRLPAFDPKNPTLREHWYRYYANDGTMRLVSWMQAGGPLVELPLLQNARAEIARAIQIKPNSHFGREKYQLRAMDWKIQLRTTDSPLSLWEYMETHRDGRDREGDFVSDAAEQRAMKAEAQGLGGLIVLGAAWESPDIFLALAQSLQTQSGAALSHLAVLRTRELVEGGHASLKSDIETDYHQYFLGPSEQFIYHINRQNAAQVDQLYPQLRAEADAWQAERTNFMESRLKAGRHPDTDPTFWQGYTSSPPPSLEVPWVNKSDKGFLERAFPSENRARFVILLGSIMICALTMKMFSQRRYAARRV